MEDIKNISKAVLYVIATPIGNLEDISFRAVRVLKEVDIIAAEDTRHSKKLLLYYGINTELISFHEHNEIYRTKKLIDCLKDNKNIALISDAGTPSICDPGYKLVKAATAENIKVLPVPGPNAVIAGLSVSGLASDSFLFSGFLPKKKRKQIQALNALKDQRSTLVFYESPNRIKTLIQNTIIVFGNRKACLAREITKLHEEYIRSDLVFILEELKQRKSIKGEISLFVEGKSKKEIVAIDESKLKKDILEKLKTKGTLETAKQIAAQYNLPKKQIYEMILKTLKKHDKPIFTKSFNNCIYWFLNFIFFRKNYK